MKRTISIIIIFITGFRLIQGCSGPECVSFATNIIVIQFLDSANNSQQVDILNISAMGTEVSFYNDTTVSKLFLPVDSENTNTTFLFNFPEGSETLEVGYSRNINLISQDCGFEFLLNDLEVNDASFPGAMVTNPEISTLIVNSKNRKNIEIYP